MLRKIEIAALFVLVFCLSAMAVQRQVLKIVPDPLAMGVKPAGSVIGVEWVQLSAPGSQVTVPTELRGDVYFASAPVAGDLSRYTRVTALEADNVPGRAVGDVTTKRSSFRPSAAGISHGTYYCIVASFTEAGDTLYSDYFTLMVETATAPTIEFPKANLMTGELVVTIPDLSPRFRWSGVSGVPYYHVILSDEPIISGSGLSSNISVIWQAITPATSITYGAPDPSGTITAAPPPLTPGKTYSWMVLNNYGNHMAYSSSAAINPVDVAQAQFRIAGTPITPPRTVWPKGDTLDLPSFELQMTGLDSRANSYRVDLFTAARSEQLGAGGLGDMNANLLVWTTTVARGAGDTLRVPLDAAGTLTGGQYTWRVYALDSRGAGSSDNGSFAAFYYKASTGIVKIKTLEMIGGAGGFASPVGFVELRTEVLSGPTQAPLAFFTGNDGYSDRAFPYGRYRISTVKEGYNTQSITVNIGSAARIDTIYMDRPQAVVYGQVVAADGAPVNMAKVTAVSEWGDTLTAHTGGSGSFTIGCNAAQWTITAEKAGFRVSSPARITLRVGDNRNFGAITLARNPNPLTGVVKNAAGGPLIGARVRVLTADGVPVDELASTPENGSFSFYLNSGTFVVTAEKAGFAMFSRSVTVTGSTVLDITLPEGAALVNGAIVGKNWDAGREDFVFAPITSALIRFWDGNDTLMVTSDATFGRFSVSLPVGKSYSVLPSAAGFNAGEVSELQTSEEAIAAGGGTIVFSDTLLAYLMISGTVRDADGVPLPGVDVFVNAEYGAAASGKTKASGRYEVRNIRDNIPGGSYTVSAGSSSYYMTGSAVPLKVAGGRPEVNRGEYNFTMAKGDKSIEWDVAGARYGMIKVVSPFNGTYEFSSPGAGEPVSARAEGVGPGDYVMEAVAESDTALLELSYHKFNVPRDAAEAVPVSVEFPLEHKSSDTLLMTRTAGVYSLSVAGVKAMPGVTITSVELFHRSEGRLNFTAEQAVDIGNQEVGKISIPVSFKPVMDGTNLFYYFRVTLSNGDVYGSSKQIFRTFVRPEPTIISRIAVTPGVTGGDMLVMPSAYNAEFKLSAFYSDQFVPITLNDGVGSVEWSISDDGVVSVFPAKEFTVLYQTPSDARVVTLNATFTASENYRMKDGGNKATVHIPVRVTGHALESISIMRRGEEGDISSAEQAGFRAQAFDKGNNAVSVSPVWNLEPKSAGQITADGTFIPAANFFGAAMVTASAGGKGAVYTEQGAEAPGQKVYYRLRRANDPVKITTGVGLGFEFAQTSIAANKEADFKMTVPQLTNYILRGPDGFRMADSVAFDVTIKNHGAIDSAITIVLDVPAHLRNAAASRSQEFMAAKWFSDSLMWIPIEGSEVSSDGARVTATLSKTSALSRKRMSKRANAGEGVQARALALEENARYALVTKTAKLSASLSISPHPFSPYIRPVKEYGQDAPAGTCIKVGLEAPEGSVRNVQVHIYNATGSRVWAVYRQNVPAGQTHQFWWNGRTSGNGSGRTSVSEVEWTRDMHLSADRPMCRNGRYFVQVIVTDMKGEQKRLMKPVVLMK